LFNSAPMRAIAYALAERARGGWRRHFAWVMRLLPVPHAFLAAFLGENESLLQEFQGRFRSQKFAKSGSFESAALDQFIAQLFGISAAELGCLSAWQVSGREAA